MTCAPGLSESDGNPLMALQNSQKMSNASPTNVNRLKVNAKSGTRILVNESARYPPEGKRSVGIARAHDYGLHFTDYIQKANQSIAVIIQIEHQDAVNNLDDILAVAGIDGVFIGPYDLSGSMNRLGDVFGEAVQEAIQTVKTKCAQKGIPVGLFLQQADRIGAELASGVSFLAVGTDTFFVWNGAQQVVNAFKAGLKR